ncbi:centlein-like [Rhinatrema bivittatum]|uniref:centlein-like n=1 Tax=Rhinatrema bivittatum TaxID=194408 RepID=UPI00112D293B|nr:centlein-like [Rhinatrema bivittatum]
MSWDTQLDSILHATESNVAKIKQRLNTAGALSKELLSDSCQRRMSAYDPPLGTLQPCPFYTHGPSQGMTAEEIAAVSSQLETQAEKMALLTQAVRRLERERQQQQQCIRNLEEEVHRLRSDPRTLSDPTLHSRVEELRREVFSELRTLREQVLPLYGRGLAQEQPPSSHLKQDLAESKRILWQECEGLRREISHIKQDLRRQEEDLLRQISDSHEMKRLQDRNHKMLQEVMSSYQSHAVDLKRTKLESEEREQELQALRTELINIKEEMKHFYRDDKVFPYAPPGRARRSRARRKDSDEGRSASETSASQLNFTDISSDDVSSALDVTDRAALHRRSPATMEPQGKSRAKMGSDLDVDDLSSDLDGLSESLPELNLSDF